MVVTVGTEKSMPQVIGRLGEADPQLFGQAGQVRDVADKLLHDFCGWHVPSALACGWSRFRGSVDAKSGGW